MSPAGNEKQVEGSAAGPARRKIHGPLRDTNPQRVRSFLEARTRANIGQRPAPRTRLGWRTSESSQSQDHSPN